MPFPAPRVVGILAGGGSLPREVAEHVVAQGGAVHIVALAGEVDDDLSAFPLTVVGWGKIGAMVEALQSAGCKELVIVGSVRRPDLAALRPDLGFLRNLPTILRIIAAGGDDSVLTRVVRFFESKGFAVVAPAAMAPELLVEEGPLGHVEARPADAADAALGFDVVRALGPFDVGQAVVVTGGRIEAIEGAEGTDAMLARVVLQRGLGRHPGASPAGVLVKRPKPGQELRIDLPAIGPGTVSRALEARLAGIAVLAGGALAAERAELIRRADEGRLFLQGFPDRSSPPEAQAPGAGDWRLERVGKRAAGARRHADAGKGAALLAALSPYAQSRGAVVDRGHVLAVESGEGAAALIARAGALRQWGRRRLSRRSGLAVLAEAADLEASIVAAAAAGLAGVALVGQPSAALGRAARDAGRLGLFLAALTPLSRTA
jgi:DUF1009 family protein